MDVAESVDLMVQFPPHQEVPVALMEDPVVAAVAVDVVVRLGLFTDTDLAATGLGGVSPQQVETGIVEGILGFATETGEIRAVFLNFHDLLGHFFGVEFLEGALGGQVGEGTAVEEVEDLLLQDRGRGQFWSTNFHGRRRKTRCRGAVFYWRSP